MTISNEEMKEIKQRAAGSQTENVAAAEGTQQKSVVHHRLVRDAERKCDKCGKPVGATGHDDLYEDQHGEVKIAYSYCERCSDAMGRP